MRKIAYLILMAISFLAGSAIRAQKYEFPVLHGPYLGQNPPGTEPEIFAPGVISTGMMVRDVAMMPDCKEIYFSAVLGNYAFSTIFFTRLAQDRWTEPVTLPFTSDLRYSYGEPAISPDGKNFFFVTNRPIPGNPDARSGFNIWRAHRAVDDWSDPQPLAEPVNTDQDEYFPSLTLDGTLYFTRQNPDRTNSIFRSRFIDGVYAEPEKLPAQVNSGRSQFNAFIAPDESYLIVPSAGRQDTRGGTDYYIVFRNREDTWSEPVNMGEKINTAGSQEYSAYVSPDKQYLFFMSARPRADFFTSSEKISIGTFLELYNQTGNGNPCIYWISARIIDSYHQTGVK